MPRRQRATERAEKKRNREKQPAACAGPAPAGVPCPSDRGWHSRIDIGKGPRVAVAARWFDSRSRHAHALSRSSIVRNRARWEYRTSCTRTCSCGLASWAVRRKATWPSSFAPASRSHPRGTVRLASPQRTGLGPRDRWLVAGRAAITSRAAACRTGAASPTGSAPARDQHQLPAPGRERVQSAAGSPPFHAGGCTPGGERPYRHPARR